MTDLPRLRHLILPALACAAALPPSTAHAALNTPTSCTLTPAATILWTASGSFQAGSNMPVGSSIHSVTGTIDNPGFSRSCAETGPYGYSQLLVVGQTAYSGATTPIAGMTYQGAQVYETGIAGIGVAVVMNGVNSVTQVGNYLVPLNTPDEGCGTVPSVGGCPLPTSYSRAEKYISYYFIKTGTVAPGSYSLNTARMPGWAAYLQTYPRRTGQYDNSGVYTPGQSTLGAPALLARINITGTLTVMAQTCRTPDVNVDMGTQAASDFTGVGSASHWVAFTLALEDCPAFANYVDTRPAATQASVVLTPTTPVIGSPANGTVALRPSGGTDATGIAIQIANSTGSALTVDGVSTNMAATRIALANTPNGRYTIPLQARYIQTGAAVTPGAANGAILFTINYQ